MITALIDVRRVHDRTAGGGTPAEAMAESHLGADRLQVRGEISLHRQAEAAVLDQEDAAALLESNSSPTDADIDRAMAGVVCRCGTYPRIRKGIQRAANVINALASEDAGDEEADNG